MSMTKKQITAVLLTVIMYLSFSSLYTQTLQDFGGGIRYSELLAQDNLDPYKTRNSATALRMISLLYESLVSYDFNNDKIVPALAESWEISSDGKTVYFNLRNNVKWHDGISFSAEDVYFTFDYIENSQVINPERKDQAGFISSAQIINTSRIAFKLKNKINNPIKRFSIFEIIPKHKFKANYLPQGKSLDNNPVGTGPYSFGNITLDGIVLLNAFDDHWKQRPYIEKISRELDSDPNVQIDRLRLGGLDMVLEARTTDVGRLRETGNIIVDPYPSLSYYFIAFNMTNSILKNQFIRKAIVYGTNREEMLKTWYAGSGEVISGPFTPRSWAYNVDIEPYMFNPEMAKNILEENGCSDSDGDGIRELKNVPMGFKLKVPIGQLANSPVQNVALAFASYMKNIGINVTVENLPFDRWKQDVFFEKNFDLVLARWAFDPAINIRPLFHSDNIFSGGKNFISYSDKNINLLLDLAAQSANPTEIKSIYNRIHELLHADLPYVFLFTVDKFVAYHLRIHNVTIDPFYFFKNAQVWYIPKAYQR